MSSLRSIEQRNWENLQQENAFWQEMLASTYMSRSYQLVSSAPDTPDCATIAFVGLIVAFLSGAHATKQHPIKSASCYAFGTVVMSCMGARYKDDRQVHMNSSGHAGLHQCLLSLDSAGRQHLHLVPSKHSVRQGLQLSQQHAGFAVLNACSAPCCLCCLYLKQSLYMSTSQNEPSPSQLHWPLL